MEGGRLFWQLVLPRCQRGWSLIPLATDRIAHRTVIRITLGLRQELAVPWSPKEALKECSPSARTLLFEPLETLLPFLPLRF